MLSGLGTICDFLELLPMLPFKAMERKADVTEQKLSQLEALKQFFARNLEWK